jgi:hypothetical protein
MPSGNTRRQHILQSTLFHIQINQCQYIDNFPEAVTSVLQDMIQKRKLRDFEVVKRKLYRINTSFFEINKEKIGKKDFFEGLYKRVSGKKN